MGLATLFSRSNNDLAPVVSRARAGDVGAVTEIVLKCDAQLLRHFTDWIPGWAPNRSILARELADDVFAKLPQDLATYQEAGRFRGWLKGVAYHRFQDWLKAEIRRRNREPDTTLHTDLPVAAPEPETSIYHTAKQRLRELVPLLSPAEREAWELHVQGYTDAEIAAKLNIKVGAVGARLTRAREGLSVLMNRL